MGEAPANKASDLNTGVSWLLAGGLDGLPETLRGAARMQAPILVSDERSFEVPGGFEIVADD